MCNSLGMKTSDELVLSASETAEILGVSIATVTRMAENGRLPAIRKLPGRTGAWIFDSRVVRRKAAELLLDQAG